ncbi:MAG TPA: glycosyltransferase family 39 protein, partial [Candidatus Brocadiales bacterium]|nr:glycosyltransferase family 39 protein [Candidatus Brocadiales bacterium]
MSNSKILYREISFICIIGILFLFLSCWNLRQPGLMSHGAIQAVQATDIINGKITHESISANQIHLNISGRYIPIMSFPYVGAFKSYIYAFVFCILGPTVNSIRLTNIVIGLAAIILTFFFTKTFAGEKVGYVATVLLATDPSYIFYIHEDWSPIGTMMLCKMASLILLICWWRSNPRLNRGLFFLISASLTLGLGFWDKFNFIWFIAALLLTMWILYQKELRLKYGYRWIVAVSFLSLIIGVILVLRFNAFGFGPGGLYHAIYDRFKLLKMVLDGKGTLYLPFYAFSEGYKDINITKLSLSFLPFLFCISTVFFVFILFIRYEKKHLFIPLIIFFIFAQITITKEALRGHHIMMLYPFIHIFCAFVLVTMYEYVQGPVIASQRRSHAQGRFAVANNPLKPIGTCILTILIIFTVVSNLLSLSSFYKELRKCGGRGHWSDAINDLVDFLKNDSTHTLVGLDWGFNENVPFLSKGKIKTVPLELKFNPEGCIEDMMFLLEEESNLYVYHTEKYVSSDWNYIDTFNKAVQVSGSKIVNIKKFYQKDDEHVFTLSRVITPHQVLNKLVRHELTYNINDPIHARLQGYKSYINVAEDSFVEQLGDGWHKIETDGAKCWRWMGKEGVAYLKNTSGTTHLEVSGYAIPKYFPEGKIEIVLNINGNETAQEVITSEGIFAIKTEIPPGFLSADFFKVEIVLDSAFVPDTFVKNGDKRKLGIIVNKL